VSTADSDLVIAARRLESSDISGRDDDAADIAAGGAFVRDQSWFMDQWRNGDNFNHLRCAAPRARRKIVSPSSLLS
jgi:hypothetical protein